MVVVPLSKPVDESANNPQQQGAAEDHSVGALRYAAAGTLAAGGAMFVLGNRRLGLLAAAAGTALAMLDQQETVKAWWSALPVYLDEAQTLIGRVQGTVDEMVAQQQKLRKILSQNTAS